MPVEYNDSIENKGYSGAGVWRGLPMNDKKFVFTDLSLNPSSQNKFDIGKFSVDNIVYMDLVNFYLAKDGDYDILLAESIIDSGIFDNFENFNLNTSPLENYIPDLQIYDDFVNPLYSFLNFFATSSFYSLLGVNYPTITFTNKNFVYKFRIINTSFNIEFIFSTRITITIDGFYNTTLTINIDKIEFVVNSTDGEISQTYTVCKNKKAVFTRTGFSDLFFNNCTLTDVTQVVQIDKVAQDKKSAETLIEYPIVENETFPTKMESDGWKLDSGTGGLDETLPPLLYQYYDNIGDNHHLLSPWLSCLSVNGKAPAIKK